jgi:hypothetical protein
VEVVDGNDLDPVWEHPVKHAIRETPRLCPPDVLPYHPVEPGVGLNPCADVADTRQEIVTQT